MPGALRACNATWSTISARLIFAAGLGLGVLSATTQTRQFNAVREIEIYYALARHTHTHTQ